MRVVGKGGTREEFDGVDGGWEEGRYVFGL